MGLPGADCWLYLLDLSFPSMYALSFSLSLFLSFVLSVFLSCFNYCQKKGLMPSGSCVCLRNVAGELKPLGLRPAVSLWQEAACYEQLKLVSCSNQPSLWKLDHKLVGSRGDLRYRPK